MIYDIKKDGTTTNIFAKYCTESYQATSSTEAIKNWTYETLRKDGKSVKTRRYQTVVSYIMSYRDGTIIKGKNNFPDKTEDESIEDRFCGLEFT